LNNLPAQKRPRESQAPSFIRHPVFTPYGVASMRNLHSWKFHIPKPSSTAMTSPSPFEHRAIAPTMVPAQ
jgi:hypothetical protein